MPDALERLKQGRHHDPFALLGWHGLLNDGQVFRAWMPQAAEVFWSDGAALQRREDSDLFEIKRAVREPMHPLLRWRDKHSGEWHETITPYSFAPQLGDLDIYLFAQGRHFHLWHVLGAHIKAIDDVMGVQFAVWAPGVRRVSVVGDFNRWNGLAHPMRVRGGSGVWELFVPGLAAGQAYKFEIIGAQGQLVIKADPMARQTFLRPETASCVPWPVSHVWRDAAWLAQRAGFDWQHQPISIYEVHAGSWQRPEGGGFLDWDALAYRLIPYVKELGYTHIELLPIAEHPLDESWGYQVTGYFSPTARHGSPDDLRRFIDNCHEAGLGVILDWVPAHFPRDDFALARFTGEPLYEHADPQRGEHRDWGTLIFDYGRHEVRNFLIANALYWLEEFHFDGLRVDAVASMIYLDYSRNQGEWTPNQYGGRENLEALAFMRELNTVVHARQPGVLTIAEESTAWPMVSRPVELGGLGFSMKWNMGWMNDNLSYIAQNPVHRKYHHNQLTFSQLYTYTENFVLPLSHDEVVHMKGSLLDKMPGDYWQRFANLRLFYAWQYAHPGKKLLFMGGEFGQWNEWRATGELDWQLMDFPPHRGIHRLLADLNRLYVEEASLHQHDFESAGFGWIDCHDSDQSVLSLMRMGEGQVLLIVLNFTPVTREHYRIGVPQAGHYRERLNTDSSWYEGSNVGNGGGLTSEPVAWMGFGQSVQMTLPPLAAVFLKLAMESF